VDRAPSVRGPRLSPARLARLARLSPGRLLQLPPRTVRLRLTAIYGGLFLVSGLALLAFMYLLFRNATGVDLIVPGGIGHGSSRQGVGSGVALDPEAARQVRRMYLEALARNSRGLHQGLLQAGIAVAIMTAVSIALGWIVAGRVLRPLRAMTATTQQISARNLHERLALPGPQDELKDLADTIDGLLERLEAHVAEQQRFAANASHELRTPLSLMQTLLDVARKDPNRDTSQLVDRLHEVNTRAIEVTEALLLLSRADRRSFTREDVDLSLIAEEATETLLPLGETHGVAIETSGERAPAIGSRALLLQVAINLVHNAIVHNLSDRGTVWVTTRTDRHGAVLSVENTGETLSPQLVATLAEPFQRGSTRIRSDHAGVGLGLAIVKSISQAHDGTLTLTPRAAGGLCVTVRLPAALAGAGG